MKFYHHKFRKKHQEKCSVNLRRLFCSYCEKSSLVTERKFIVLACGHLVHKKCVYDEEEDEIKAVYDCPVCKEINLRSKTIEVKI